MAMPYRFHRRLSAPRGPRSLAVCSLLLPLVATALAAQPAPIVRALLDDAAARYDVPRTVLYGVAYNESRWHDIPADSLHASCTGMPPAYGIMGLHDDPYFGHSLGEGLAIGITAAEARSSMEKNILVGAHRLASLFDGGDRRDIAEWTRAIGRYGGIPDSQAPLQLLYADGVFELIRRGWTAGDMTIAPARAPIVDRASLARDLETMGIAAAAPGADDAGAGNAGPDYAGANWQASPNFSSRGGAAVTAITIHDTEGNFAGSLSWLCNTASGASAHYIVRSVDGLVVQMVREADKAWHVRDENPYTIGIEHEGFADRPEFYTPALYGASASLARYLIGKYSIPLDRTRVKGHIDFPNNTHTDPGGWWDWAGYYRLIARSPGARVVLDRFEDNIVGWWQPAMSGSTVKLDADRTSFAIAPQSAFTGGGGARLDYAFTEAAGGAARYFRSGHGNTSDGLLYVGSSGHVTLAVKGDGGGAGLELWFYDNAKGNRILRAGTIGWTGWRTISVPLAALGSGGPYRFHSIVLQQTQGARASGTIAVDDLALDANAAGVDGPDGGDGPSGIARRLSIPASEPLPAALRPLGPVRIVSLLGREVARYDEIPSSPIGDYLVPGFYLLLFSQQTLAVTIPN